MVRVAVTQQEPVYFDLAGAVDKACKLIAEAASNGAQLIAFPEVWICGYPMWIWSRALDPVTVSKYITNSLSYDSPEMQKICDSAKQNSIAVILGFSERDGDTLYISQCTISGTGEILNKRRKLKPSHMEKTIYGDGDEKSLFSVVDIKGIGKTGALSCFEHTQPLLKFHNIAQGEKIHVAAWPPLRDYENTMEEVFSMTAEGCQTLSQAYAIESGTFVLHCTAVESEVGLKAMNISPGPVAVLGGGNSAVFAPDGRRLTEPIKSDEEGIVYADLPMDFGLVSKQIVDVIGHGGKPGVLWLGVDGKQKDLMRVLKNDEDANRTN